MASPGDVEVAHDAGARRFVARAGGERGGGEIVGYIAYEPGDGGALDLLHTVVMPEHRGNGIGERLVRDALAHARESGARVIPSCPFVSAYLEDHPGDRDVVADP
jgi:uncharacterized protein